MSPDRTPEARLLSAMSEVLNARVARWAEENERLREQLAAALRLGDEMAKTVDVGIRPVAAAEDWRRFRGEDKS